MNKEIRRQVFERAAGRCECGCGRAITPDSGHLDHFFGRAKAPETVENCWALHPICDEAKTSNRPNATYWAVRFGTRMLNQGHVSSALRALAKIEVLAVKGFA